MYPINQRFYALCLALKIDPQDEADPQEVGTRGFYVTLRRKVLSLLESRYFLVDGSPDMEKQRNGGASSALWRELGGVGVKTRMIAERTAQQAVYRLHGLLETPNGDWQLPPCRPSERAREPIWEQFEQNFSVVPQQVRERIFELCTRRRDLMDRYIGDAIAYFRGKRPELSPPEPPWNEHYEFERGHEFIEEFLERARRAVCDITLAAVDFYITASIARPIFLERLKSGTHIRVLIFDFVRGDVPHVARMIRRAPGVLCALSNDTVEALLWLRDEARAAGAGNKLEVRLLSRDPQGRWYLVDATAAEGNGASAFTAPRAPGLAAKDARGGWDVKPETIRSHVREVEELWQEAEPFESWLPAYEHWRSLPETKQLLGMSERTRR